MPTQQTVQPVAADPTARPLPALKEQFASVHREMQRMLESPERDGTKLAQRHALVVDELLRRLYAAAGTPQPVSRPLLMGAVGGYGRRLLGLKSDLDLCFVTDRPPEEVAPLVEAILYPLWDAGIDVGHQVVRVSEVVADVEHDLPMATELLDFRPIAGDIALMRAVRQRLAQQLFAEDLVPAFIKRLEAGAEARHERFGDSVYLLEPDVKNGTGGLRDLDFALWAARARFGTSDLERLASLGILTRGVAQATSQAMEFLWRIRNRLHQLAGRKSDRLTFAAQEHVARAMGYDDGLDAGVSELERNGAMVERFMSDYYRHARAMTQCRDRVLGYAKRRPLSGPHPLPRRLDADLIQCAGRVGLDDPARLMDQPVLALRLYSGAVRRDLAVLARSRDAVAAASAEPGFCERLRDDPEAARLFIELLCDCRKAAFRGGSILAELHDVGLLVAMIPEFAPVVGRVHHDLYHVYTVDVHSVAAVDRLRALTRGEFSEQLPLACRLAVEVTRPRVLFLATLLHDVGKAIGGHQHAERGARMAESILRRLGLTDEEIEDACHLVLHHLTMYLIAARRDLGDPATLAEFVQAVHGHDGLCDLYLLTVADLSTTSPVAMTKWKASMLTGLYRTTDAYLAGPEGNTSARISARRHQVVELWEDPGSLEALAQFLDSMPDRYFLSNTPAQIRAHAALAIAPRTTPVGVSLVPSEHEGVMGLCVVTKGGAPGTGLCVVAGDRPGLLAAISAAIYASNLRIESAQINSRAMPNGDRQAVDLFWVRGLNDEDPPAEVLEKLERDLTAVVAGHVPANNLVRPPRPSRSWDDRRLPPISTQVTFDYHGSADHTIIEVMTEDRPALLFTLADALHSVGLSISVAKICTEGKRAVDVFYATEMDGTKLQPGPRAEEIRLHVVEALGVASA